MEYNLIYDFDIERNASVRHFQPPRSLLKRKFQLTEGDEQYQYDYLAEEMDDSRYRNGKHRKYVALLTQEEFDAFIEKVGLMAEDTPTMGMLGSATGLGWSPAISFHYECAGYGYEPINASAYVEPLPSAEEAQELGLIDPDEETPLFPIDDEVRAQRSENNWKKVVEWIMEKYGY